MKHAFTMAEILLSLTIIGVVAAITLPSLTGNINERTWNTQRKALFSRLTQALALMPALNGYGEYSGTNTDGAVTVEKDTAAITFVTNGLAKVLKLNNICEADKLSDCGITAKYTDIAASQKNMPTDLNGLNPLFTTISSQWASAINPQNNINTQAAAFETQNGESIVVFYNPSCVGSDSPITYISWTSNATHRKYNAQPYMCANFIYDLNGKKGPNTVGKDIGFMTALYPTDTVLVDPLPLTKDIENGETYQWKDASSTCTKFDKEYRLPTKEEWMSIMYNRDFAGVKFDDNGVAFWTSTSDSVSGAWCAWVRSLSIEVYPKTTDLRIRCTKR